MFSKKTHKTNMVSDDDSSVRRVPVPRTGRCRPVALLRDSVLSSAPSSPLRALQSPSKLSPAPSDSSCALQSLSELSPAPSDSSRALQSLSVLSPAPLDSSRTLQSLSVLSPAPSVPLRALLRPSNSLFTFQSLFEPSHSAPRTIKPSKLSSDETSLV